MASMLGISESTLRRRLGEFELSTSRNFAQISDDELDHLVMELKYEFQNSGYRMIVGILRGKGIYLQQQRLIECLRRVDIEGVIARTLQLGIIYRRNVYMGQMHYGTSTQITS